jgi:hypothetical protein
MMDMMDSLIQHLGEQRSFLFVAKELVVVFLEKRDSCDYGCNEYKGFF